MRLIANNHLTARIYMYIHYFSLQCHVLQKSFYYADLVLKNILIFFWKPWYIYRLYTVYIYIYIYIRILWEQKAQKNSIYSTQNIHLCYIINVFNVTFDQFNVYLMNKSLEFLSTTTNKISIFTPNVLYSTITYKQQRKICQLLQICQTPKSRYKWAPIVLLNEN